MSHVTLRPLRETDLATAHRLSQALQWPHRLEDWQCLFHTGEGLVLEDDQGVFGTGFCVPQGDYATIGLVIVADSHQGKGHGRRLMDGLLQLAGTRTPLLVATVRGAPLYRSQGFESYERIYQHQIATLPAVTERQPMESQVCELTPAAAPQLERLAQLASGLDRTALLRELLPQAERLVGLESEGQLRGFALLRPYGRGLSVGPVIAESSEQAKALILTLLRDAEGRYVRFDVTARSGLNPWLLELGIPQVDEVEQMARGKAPEPRDGLDQFALLTQALG
ncbi:GNAT family N-acetyltransferase [uncultured Pseudomonas sp.]|uniref:GNAT family N-acetyltransferase n=1 Tax=uncultured Pseudomonas sp. TaxID=114707 RepID=UPI0025DB36BE|nr:GNAT family N-acetyltransferase [uncultured Pseudomonas sp.]